MHGGDRVYDPIPNLVGKQKKMKQMIDEPHALYDSGTHRKCTRPTLENVPAWPAHHTPAVGRLAYGILLKTKFFLMKPTDEYHYLEEY